jgi:hypothetical protein
MKEFLLQFSTPLHFFFVDGKFLMKFILCNARFVPGGAFGVSHFRERILH